MWRRVERGRQWRESYCIRIQLREVVSLGLNRSGNVEDTERSGERQNKSNKQRL